MVEKTKYLVDISTVNDLENDFTKRCYFMKSIVSGADQSED